MKIHPLGGFVFVTFTALGLLGASGCSRQTANAAPANIRPVSIHDGKTRWELRVKSIPPGRLIPEKKDYYVYAFHSEIFPNRYAVAQSREVFKAFEAISDRFPQCHFTVAIVGNNRESQTSINARAQQDDEGPTKGQIFDFLEVLNTPDAKLPAFMAGRKNEFIALEEGIIKGLPAGAPNPVTPLTLHSPGDPYSILTDFGTDNAVPRFFITDAEGKILHAIAGAGLEAYPQLLVALQQLPRRQP